MYEVDFSDSGLGERELGLFLAAHSLSKADPNSAEGRAYFVLNGTQESYKAFLLFMKNDVDTNFLLTAPAREPVVAKALQELEKCLNNGREILKTDVISLRDKLAAEIAIKRPEFSQDSAAQAAREEGWLTWVERRCSTGEGSHLERQKYTLRALTLGNETAYRALVNCGPDRQEWFLGDLNWFPKWEEQWLNSKVNPLKKDRLVALTRLVSRCEEGLTKAMELARKRAGQGPSPEQQMREGLETLSQQKQTGAS